MTHDLARRATAVDVSALSDADKSLPVLPPDLRPVSAAARFAGRAVTADAHDDLMSVIAGLEAAGPGDVLVVAGNGSQNALAGELFAHEAARRGLAALVLDGPCRDTRTLRTMTLPVFARGATPRACPAKAEPRVNVPITVGGVTINPGDYLVGDEDGVRVATPDALADAIDTAESIRATEDALLAAITEGTSLFDKLNFHEHVAALSAGEPSSLRFL